MLHQEIFEIYMFFNIYITVKTLWLLQPYIYSMPVVYVTGYKLHGMLLHGMLPISIKAEV